MYRLELERECKPTLLAGVYATREEVDAEVARREAIYDSGDQDDGGGETPDEDVIEGYDCVVTDLETGERFVILSDEEWEELGPEPTTALCGVCGGPPHADKHQYWYGNVCTVCGNGDLDTDKHDDNGDFFDHYFNPPTDGHDYMPVLEEGGER